MPRVPARLRFQAHRRPAPGHRQRCWRGCARRPLPDAAGRHRLGQDLCHGQHHRGACSAPRWSSPTTRPWPRSSIPSSRSSFRTTPSSTLSATTTITSPRPTSRAPTPISKKTPRSTKRSTACACRPPQSLFSRRDVIIVASVSCIYGLGDPEEYGKVVINLHAGETAQPRPRAAPAGRASITSATTSSSRAASSACAATRWRSCPPMRDTAYRIEFWGDEVERIARDRPAHRRDAGASTQPSTSIPAKHFVTPQDKLDSGARRPSRHELEERLEALRQQDKLLEAQRLEQRTRYDLEMLREVGYLLRHRELFAAPVAAPAGRAALDAAGLFPRRLSCCSSTSRT